LEGNFAVKLRHKIVPFTLAALALLPLSVQARALDTEADSRLLALVNKTHTISSDYIPELTFLASAVPVTNSQVALRPEAAEAYIEMYQAMKESGITRCLGLSGYRSYATQSSLLARRVAQRQAQGMSAQAAYQSAAWYTAPAGASEHQTGLAMDCTEYADLSQSFAGSAAGRWLSEHAWEYGFILRYEPDKSGSTMIGGEAWHYRYVGVPHAKIITESCFCLEEYISYLHTQRFVSTQVGETVYDIFWTDDAGADFSGMAVEDLSGDNAGGWIVTVRREEGEAQPGVIPGVQTVQVDQAPPQLVTVYTRTDGPGAGESYIRLRDAASLLGGTACQFNVLWDGAPHIERQEAYFPNGSELDLSGCSGGTCQRLEAGLELDGESTGVDCLLFTSQAGDSATLCSLSDLGQALGFDVSRSGEGRLCLRVCAR